MLGGRGWVLTASFLDGDLACRMWIEAYRLTTGPCGQYKLIMAFYALKGPHRPLTSLFG